MERTTDNDALRSRELHLQSLFLSGLDGDERAYRTFLSELSGHLRGFLRSRLQQRPGEIEDLLQEVLLAVHNARQTYQADQPLTAWVFAIARYKLIDFFRGRSRHDVFNDSLDDAAELFAEPHLEPAQASRDLGKLLEQLPERQRLPIVRVKLEGLSVTEAAQTTGLSESAVKIGIHRGLKALALRVRGTP
ncbi:MULTISPECIES: sigma-70 family RNA polymerase sigma factor [Pseudomonas]|jgi:RNA polymerase sigma-70 factor (ECF subfamily)|uniref:RNA polymerase sigma factor n=1 Tax=Pseudomonas frederiksbergensis TaxID=104087 RepID=A0A0B1Z7V1_9PSED|nr:MULTISPECIES: sigma-70 family RNA polymerase sigma factor [Pseudomonas]KHK65291.1 RNA polymerase sigma factor [Pseudomonas frederiksbergensis]KJH81761.1 RNA polymerase sigma factor [Pseudomonas fluorescens]MBI6619884.1 sigma-70 family RNA polymerase sigma factor [Pseudomonas corrugata]MBI6692701.1 sigma-70 family RNA polymerase sigma factor [Pseudomonas corrugata]WRV67957.1 sigma-70 family RNA polymerase sigma factor [Pseudomonas frederiksbergensis]